GAPRAQGGEESVATTERYEALEGLVTRASSGRGGRVIDHGVIVMRHEVQLPGELCVLPTRRGTKGGRKSSVRRRPSAAFQIAVPGPDLHSPLPHPSRDPPGHCHGPGVAAGASDPDA